MGVAQTAVRFETGVTERIDEVVGKGRRAEFIREAVNAELARRERAAKRKKPDA